MPRHQYPYPGLLLPRLHELLIVGPIFFPPPAVRVLLSLRALPGRGISLADLRNKNLAVLACLRRLRIARSRRDLAIAPLESLQLRVLAMHKGGQTGAAKGLGQVIPELDGRLDGFAMRVPTVNVSAVDLSFAPERETSEEEINQIMLDASLGELKGVLEYCEEPLVSIDFNHNPASAIYDSTLTKVMQGLA